MSSPATPSRPRLSYAVAFLERMVRRVLAETMSPFDLTLAHYTVLSLLDVHESLSNAQLARRAYVTPQAMSEIVRHLEERGLVVRSPSPAHARIHPTRLTPKGRSTLEKCDTEVDLVERKMMAEAGIADQAPLVETLVRCARFLATYDGAQSGGSGKGTPAN